MLKTIFSENINFSDRIREIYNALDDFNTQEQLITEVENCVHLLINYEDRGC